MNNITTILNRADLNTSTCIKDSFRLLDDPVTLRQLIKSIQDRNWDKLNGVKLKKYFVVLRNSLFEEDDVSHLKDIGIDAPASLKNCFRENSELNISTAGLDKDQLLDALSEVLKLALRNQTQDLESLQGPSSSASGPETSTAEEQPQVHQQLPIEVAMSLSKDDITRIATELKSMMEVQAQTASKNSERPIDVDVEQYRLNRASENNSKITHPWIKFILEFGHTKSIKDLRHISCDWMVIRAITRWCSEVTPENGNKENVDKHKRCLLFAVSKISGSYLLVDESNQTNKSTSLLIRLVNIIDTNFAAGSVVTNSQVREWVQDFSSELDIPRRSAQRSSSFTRQSRGKPKSTKIQICKEYNRDGVCSYEDKCRYQHVCQRHFDLNGSLEEHPEADCTE